MAKPRVQPYTKRVQDLMAQKSAILSQAQALSEIGMAETTLPLWASAASLEEHIAPLLDVLGRDLEAAVHRISAASCYHKAGDRSRAANLYRAALAGPLGKEARRDVWQMLSDCLRELSRPSEGSRLQRSARRMAPER
jgi:hypothetical protein